MRIIDGHCHVGNGAYKKLTAKDLLQEMDHNHVDMAVICPVEEQIVIDNHIGNEVMLQYQKEHPDRFIGFAVANPWAREKAIEELRWALGEGLCGVKFNTSLQGCFINDTIVYDLIRAVQEFHVPVYFHTGTPIYSMPLQLKCLAEDFPDVDFIMGHTGYADTWTDVMPACKNSSNIYLETSIVAVNPKGPEMTHLGPSRFIYGSDVPVSSMGAELNKLKNMDVSNEDLQMILGGNMERLLSKRK